MNTSNTMQMQHIYPLLGSIFYLYFPKKIVKDVEPSSVNNYAIIHNVCLQMFSMYVAYNLLYALYTYGIVIERNYYFQYKHIDNVIYYFYLSKYYEYVDTIILYAKKREPIFLQKFHHLGAVIVWHLGYVNKCEGMLFVCLWNSIVHSIMYLYYLLALLKFDVNKYRIYITSLQLVQLLTGSIMLPYFFYTLETSQNKNVIVIFNIYIVCLLYLFSEFMVKNYLVKNNKIKNQ
jgi:hypothetical protein